MASGAKAPPKPGEAVEVSKPFAGFDDFSDCLHSMRQRGHSEDSARRICGKLQAESEKGDVEKKTTKPFGSPGGKDAWIGQLVSRVPEHQVYVEPYAGSATLFWAKEKVAKEVLIEIDGDIVEMFMFLRDGTDDDFAWLRNQDWAPSKNTFDKLKAMLDSARQKGARDPARRRQRVYQFKYTNLFSMRRTGQSFDTSERAQGYTGKMFLKNLEKFRERLQGVTIIEGDGLRYLKKYDGPNTFFYFDPPWKPVGSGDAWKGFDEAAFTRAVHGLHGKALVSYQGKLNLGEQWKVDTVAHTTGGGNGGETIEQLYYNYDMKADEKKDETETQPLDDEHKYATVRPDGRGGRSGKPVGLSDVLEHYTKPIALRMPAIYLVGSLCNQGRSESDIDFLLRGPMDEYTKRVVEYRLSRALPEPLSRRVQFHYSKDGGPFTNHVPLYDVVLVPHVSQGVVQMSLNQWEQADGTHLMDPPTLLDGLGGSGPNQAEVYYSWVGKSVYLNLRMFSDGFATGWTIAAQRQEVEKSDQLVRTAGPDGDAFFKPLLSPAQLLAVGKVGQAQPCTDRGPCLTIDTPQVEWGYQSDLYHEYFLTKGERFNGILLMRQVPECGETGDGDVSSGFAERTGDSIWVATLAKDLLPLVLTDRAVREGWMPKDGHSGLPLSLEKAVPPEFRYWKVSGLEAQAVRDALVKARVFAHDNVKMVNREFCHTRTKLYLSAPPDDTDALPSVPAEKSLLESVVECVGGDTDLKMRDLRHDGEGPDLADVTKCADDQDFLVLDYYSPAAVEELAKFGRPFRLVGEPDLVCVTSAPIVNKSAVEWCEDPSLGQVEKEYKPEGSTFIEHCRNWVESRGLLDDDSDYAGMLGEAVLRMAEVFSKEGHSGMSAHYARAYFNWMCDAWDGMNTMMLNDSDFAQARAAFAKSAVEEIEKIIVKTCPRRKRTLRVYVYKVRDDNQLHAAIGPIAKSEIENWSNVISDGARLYVHIGEVTCDNNNPDHMVSAGTVIEVDVESLNLDLSGARKSVSWKDPSFVAKTDDRPMTLQQVANVAFSTEVADSEIYRPVLKTEEERFVLVPVLEPETTDAQGDIYSAEEIRHAAHHYMETSRKIKLMHRGEAFDENDVQIIESYVSLVDFQVGERVVKLGTWLIALRVWSDRLWAAIKAGELTGVSIGGLAIRLPTAA